MQKYKELLRVLGFQPKENAVDVYAKMYPNHRYVIEVDFQKEQINYGPLIKSESKTTQNFSQAENWVVLECVDRLLTKGYAPDRLILEKTWPAGHGTSGRLDVCVLREKEDSEYLLIECKTYGKEFDKAVTKMNKDGDQLFTYFKFSNKADVIMLYTSELQGQKVVYKNEIVKIEDDYRAGDVKDFYEKWNKLTKDNGIFESWVSPYCFANKALIKSQLKPINQEDSGFIFNRFLEILRHNVVPDPGTAYNKIFTLFLCKVYDETSQEDDEELDFQWKEGVDDHVSFQLRLTDLYKKGMQVFLSRTVSDFDESEFDNKYKHLSQETKAELLKEINMLRLEKNNEFAIKEVYDHDSFVENAKIIKEVVELLQGYKIRYNKRQQYLSDFFELLLTTGLKQEAGQFFTPVPVAQFIIKSLPLEETIDKTLSSKTGDLLPYMIDYAAGSGHFITEYMHEVQDIINKKSPTHYIERTKKQLNYWQSANYEWATDYVYGIEKDYRLVKVGKVGCYLHGDGLANVILSDGLGNFANTKDYKRKLRKKQNDGQQDNQQFDILLSNPPYSVAAFRQTTRDYYTEKDFDLYQYLTDNSSEIECLFVERMKQLLKDGGLAGIILPSSILTNGGIYTKTRELLLKYFEFVAITELGSNTFMATGTNTVVLFLRRRNNYEYVNLQQSVDKFFNTHTDGNINGIEHPVEKYINHVWEGLTLDDYLTLLNKQPNEKVQKHDLYREYKQKLKVKKEQDFWNKVLSLEKEKLFYFVLVYPQQLVVVRTGEKDAEKRFLGYEFSNRRGAEGIHAIQRGKSIEECTRLFDAHSFDNPQKASTYIYKAFKGDTACPIDDTLQKNIFRVDLVDMMPFDRADFEKTINTKIKRKLKIQTKWPLIPLARLESEGSIKFFRGQGLTKDNLDDKGQYKCILYGELYTKYISPIITNVISRTNVKTKVLSQTGDVLVPATTTADAMGISIGRAISEDNIQIGGDINIIRTQNRIVLAEYLAILLCTSLKKTLAQYVTGTNILHLSNENIRTLKVPLPPRDVQQQIVDEIEKVEIASTKIKQDIAQCNQQIRSLLRNLYTHAKARIKLGDTDVFDLCIGKRVLAGDMNPQGVLPVYSANVFEPFGRIDKHLLTNFDCASVVWGIDGDWRVNVFPKRFEFYPTDHCGFIRLKKDNIILEKYLCFALEQEGKEIGFSRTKRASIDRIAGIAIPLPDFKDQQRIVAEVETLEQQIEQAQTIIKQSEQQKQAILDKYLK